MSRSLDKRLNCIFSIFNRGWILCVFVHLNILLLAWLRLKSKWCQSSRDILIVGEGFNKSQNISWPSLTPGWGQSKSSTISSHTNICRSTSCNNIALLYTNNQSSDLRYFWVKILRDDCSPIVLSVSSHLFSLKCFLIRRRQESVLASLHSRFIRFLS